MLESRMTGMTLVCDARQLTLGAQPVPCPLPLGPQRAEGGQVATPALVTSAVTVRPVVLRLAYLKVVYDKPWP